MRNVQAVLLGTFPLTSLSTCMMHMVTQATTQQMATVRAEYPKPLPIAITLTHLDFRSDGQILNLQLPLFPEYHTNRDQTRSTMIGQS